MDQYFPFSVTFVNGARHGSPEQMYQILVDFGSPDLSAYKSLFEKYSPSEGLISLVDVVTLIIEGNAPDLLDHMDFDEEGYLLDMYADSEMAVQEFASVVCAAFQDIEELGRYVRKIADQ
ncbi:hypothetical protein [Hymenobacter coccineus]|uniref:hypothetical protein n=1 Tax=Hymenobacter coccineus TaxID=1908235 RepID=UPI000F7B1A5C|nr:hypothetical protein [Hymenobacter coccineus]